MSLSSSRKTTNVVALSLSLVATVVGLFFLAAILVTLVWQGLSSISPALFTESTPPPNSQGGGLVNAIFGSVVMSVCASLVATPVGILAGTYLTE